MNVAGAMTRAYRLPSRRVWLGSLLVLVALGGAGIGRAGYERYEASRQATAVDQAVLAFSSYAQGAGQALTLQGINRAPDTWVYQYMGPDGATFAIVRVGSSWLSPVLLAPAPAERDTP